MRSILEKLGNLGQQTEFIFWGSCIQLTMITQTPILRIFEADIKLSEDFSSDVCYTQKMWGNGAVARAPRILSFKTIADTAGLRSVPFLSSTNLKHKITL